MHLYRHCAQSHWKGQDDSYNYIHFVYQVQKQQPVLLKPNLLQPILRMPPTRQVGQFSVNPNISRLEGLLQHACKSYQLCGYQKGCSPSSCILKRCSSSIGLCKKPTTSNEPNILQFRVPEIRTQLCLKFQNLNHESKRVSPQSLVFQFGSTVSNTKQYVLPILPDLFG